MPSERVAMRSATGVKSVTALLHAGFVLIGIVNTVLGPLLPILTSKWTLDDAHAGYLFTSQFIGSVLGVTGSSWIVPRWGSRLALVLGLAAMAAGMGSLGSGPWVAGMISTFCMGVGMGLTIPTTNLLISELNPHRRAAALNFINLAWGLGAVICPFLIAGLDRLGHVAWLRNGVAVLLVLLAVILIQTPFPDAAGAEGHGPQVVTLSSRMWRSRFVPILGAMFFLYVGSETSVGGWIAAYAHRVMANPGAAWAMMPSFFWAALLVGRATAPPVLRHVPEIRLARMGLAMAAAGVISLLVSRSGWTLAASTALAGLGFSSIYPIAIAMLSHKFGAFATRIGGLTFTLAGFGGATLPWLVGYLSTGTGSLRIGLVVPLVGCILMFLLSLSFGAKSDCETS